MTENNTTTTGTTTVTSDTPYFDPAPEITPDEYQTRFIDFYNMPTITDPVVIDDDDDDDDDQDVQPNVLAPVKSDDDKPTIFGAGVTLGGKSSFDFKTKDFNEVINDYVDPSKAVQDGAKKDKSLGGFTKAITDMYKTPEGAIGSGVGFMMGLGPLGGPALSAMAELNRKKQKETADAIAATGGSGGTMFELNGQLVYRKPGETIFSGVFEGTQKQMAGLEHMSKGFLPGMMKEIAESGPGDMDNVYTQYGKEALATATGVAIDAYGTVTGSDGSSQNVSATQATLARNKFTTDLMTEMGYTGSQISAATAGGKDLSQQLKQALNEHMNQFKTGLFHKTSNVALGDYNQHLKEAKKFSSEFLKNKLTKEKPKSDDGDDTSTTVVDPASVLANEGPDRGPTVVDPASVLANEGPDKGSASDDKQSDKQGSGSQYGDKGGQGDEDKGSSGMGYDGSGGDNRGYRALGGRVGYAPGGVARAAPAGFVERPPSQVSEAATVADDKPMSVPEGTFVINAAAVEFAGEKDIMDMLNVAYKKAEKKGVQPPSKEMLEVAVSRGEVIVPAFLAKIIGYDRLEKINNRGKKEVNQRIKENGQRPTGAFEGGRLEEQGFVNRKKKETDPEALNYEDKIIKDEVSRKMNLLMDEVAAQNFEEKGNPITVLSQYFKSGSAEKDYYDEVGRINQMTAPQGRFFANPSQKVVNVPKKPTLLNLFIMAEEVAHLDAERDRNPATRKNPYRPKPALSLEDLFDKGLLDIEKINEQQNKTPVMGAEFDPYEAFNLESRYLEELRAKQIAFDTVLGMLPKDKKAARMAKASYERMFGDYIEATASPVIKAAYLEKYPELKDFPRLTAVSEEFKKANHAKRVAESRALTRGMPTPPRISPDVISRIIERMEEEQAEETAKRQGRMIQLRKRGAGSRLKKRK